jgi:hypothetical protein
VNRRQNQSAKLRSPRPLGVHLREITDITGVLRFVKFCYRHIATIPCAIAVNDPILWVIPEQAKIVPIEIKIFA